MSVFVKAILTLQRQVRNLTRRINNITGGASTGGTITEDFTISDEYIQGNYFINISTNSIVSLPTPEVGKSFKFFVSTDISSYTITFQAGTNTITGSVTSYFDSDEPFDIFNIDNEHEYVLENSRNGTWLEFNCVNNTSWMMTSIKNNAV